MPLAILPLMLLIIPIVEIGAFIAIGGQIGILPTLAGILITAIIGTYFLRKQGLGLLAEAQAETQAGRIPAKALGDGVLLLVAGILLLTPGFVTDVIGFLLFVPPVRAAIRKFVAARVTVVAAQQAGFDPSAFGQGGFGESRPRPPHGQNMGDGPVIDLDADDYDVADDKPSKPNPNSPWRDG
ncbi:FxsA family protein [Ahrensia sp. R2A130]|uniref:FxsA family protein n=1 Tax=Ahrensia sp. R2A130 TaxID=744979 RepID=UPI0001E0B4A5|nr:FxsA family protein [Ahrensia sp. R2A130]EFL89730.1 FxsA [Ahrensia sp. R2A130]